jgi:uncharacterized membrane protein YhhN
VTRVTTRTAALATYLAVAAVHLLAQAVDTEALAAVTQVLLMPALAVFLVASRPPTDRLGRAVLLALVLSWLGDTVPRFLGDDAAFLAMVGCFLLAQLAFVAAFLPYRAESVAGRRRGLLMPYVAVLLLLLAACVPDAGALAPAVVVYGGCLVAMAVLATGVHPLAAAGGVLFLVSDGLIALAAFADWWRLPQQDLAVMATYVAAQLLIVLGVLRRSERGAAVDLERTPGVTLAP